MSAIVLTNSNFDETIKGSAKKVVVDFWAAWCGPCKMISPIIEELSDERDDIVVGKVNVDEEAELCMRFGISSIPSILVFDKGELVNKGIGYMPKEDLINLIG